MTVSETLGWSIFNPISHDYNLEKRIILTYNRVIHYFLCNYELY
jgi:hypothetical protein